MKMEALAEGKGIYMFNLRQRLFGGQIVALRNRQKTTRDQIISINQSAFDIMRSVNEKITGNAQLTLEHWIKQF